MKKEYHSKEYLIKQLKNEKNYVQIAREHRVDTSTIQRYMRKYDLTKKRNLWSKKEIDFIRTKYYYGQKIYDLFPNRSISAVYHKAFRLGIKRLVRKRKYYVNHNFFKKWSSEMAYILGFFFSDGNVCHKQKEISIHLNEKDHYIQEKMAKVMQSNRPINIYSGAGDFKINSKILAKDLVKIGCIPNKSLILKFPQIKNKFLSHFIRGYFDGDGSIHFNKPNTIKISFCGTKEFITILQNKLYDALSLKIHPVYKDKTIYVCHYYGYDARKLCKWMYEDTKGLYLKRKRKRFEIHLLRRKNGKIQTSHNY